jgi:hypothetical protein
MPRRRLPRGERRWRREGRDRLARRTAQRDTYLRALMETGETELAIGRQGLVTDRRILLTWDLHAPPHEGERAYDAISFREVTMWAIGSRHDERPVLLLRHPPHPRLEWTPAHHVLWMRWGNTTATVTHTETTLEFGRKRHPMMHLIVSRLERTQAVEGDPFIVLRPGVRAAVRGPRVTQGVLLISESRTKRLAQGVRGRLARLDDRLHNGQIAWPIRVGSWLIVAVPAWFIRPWLAVVAIAAVEVSWVVGLQWSARRDRRRGRAPTCY